MALDLRRSNGAAPPIDRDRNTGPWGYAYFDPYDDPSWRPAHYRAAFATTRVPAQAVILADLLPIAPPVNHNMTTAGPPIPAMVPRRRGGTQGSSGGRSSAIAPGKNGEKNAPGCSSFHLICCGTITNKTKPGCTPRRSVKMARRRQAFRSRAQEPVTSVNPASRSNRQWGPHPIEIRREWQHPENQRHFDNQRASQNRVPSDSSAWKTPWRRDPGTIGDPRRSEITPIRDQHQPSMERRPRIAIGQLAG